MHPFAFLFSRFRPLAGLMLLCLLLPGSLMAAQQVYSDQVDRPDFLGGDGVEVTDSWYSFMTANPTTWNQQFQVQQLKNYVILSVNHDDFGASASDFTADVQVEITTYVQSGSTFSPVTTIKTLSIEKSSTNPYHDKVIYEVPNPGHRMFVDIVPVHPTTAAQYAHYNLRVEGRVEVERYFTFNTATVPSGLSSSLNGTTGDLEVSWPTVPGAEGYELEWTHYYADNNSTFPAFRVDDLRHNATRITTKRQQYAIPMLYDKGWVLYRVRAIGRIPDNGYASDVPGNWSSNTYLGSCNSGVSTVACFTDRYYFSGHQGKFNWQSSMTFAEEGKSKQMVDYFDGSNLSRQQQIRLNSDHHVIVGENVYDYSGRAAITTLPVPITSELLGYRSNFNQKDGTTDAYHASDFDKLLSDPNACAPVPYAMSTSTGSAKYYSPNSDFVADYPEIPDAEKYPFSHTTYMADNTGRVKEQSGVGAPFRTGNGHTTQTFYGKPFQEELDMLFASDAGYSEFYQKQMVIDPNGQVAVTYTDLAGNVIATGLEGDVPANMIALDDASIYNLQVDLLNKLSVSDASGSANRLVNEGRTKESNTTFLLTSDQVVDVSYEMPGEVYDANCAGTVTYADGTTSSYSDAFCYECIYDLTISLQNDCGEEFLYRKSASNPNAHTTSVIGQSILDDMTNGTFTEATCPVTNPPSFNSATDITFPTGGLQSNDQTAALALTKGSYTINKKLTINKDALNYYTQHYLENNDCLLDYTYFETEAIHELDFDGCGMTCDQCTTSVNALLTEGYTQTEVDALLQQCGEMCGSVSATCQAAYNAMLADMSPNGQYGKVSPGTGVSNGVVINGPQATAGNIDASPYRLSVFNTTNYLPRKNLFITQSVEPNWKNPMFQLGGGSYAKEYRNADGSLSLILLNNLGTGYEPAINGSPIMSGGLPYARPEQLAHLEDFVAYWKSNWAQSLVLYHPEYGYYEQCQARETSNLFDDDVLTMDYTDVVDDGLNVVPGGSANPNILLADPYFTQGNQEFLAAKFFMKNFSIKDPSVPSYYSMYDVAKILINHPGQGSFDQCSSLPTPNGSALSLEEWEIFRALYVSLKQKFLAHRDRQIAINSGFYNGCIGTEDFDAFRYNFFQNTTPFNNGLILAQYGITGWPNLNSQFYNIEQPCNYMTFVMYKNKTARFGTVAQYLDTEDANEGGCSYTTTAYGEFSNLHSTCTDYVNSYSDELADKAAATYLAACGVCPFAKDLENLLNVAIEQPGNHLLSGTGTHQLTCLSAGDPYLVYTPALNDALLNGATPSGNAEFSGQSTANEVKLDIDYGISPSCELRMKFADPNSPYNVNQIESFCCLKLTSSPGIYPASANGNFIIKATVDDGTGVKEEVLMEGVLPCLNFLRCEAELTNCDPSPTAKQMQRLLNGLLYQNASAGIAPLLWNSNVNIGTGIYRQVMGDELFQGLHTVLNSSATDINQGTLQWTSNLSGSTLGAQLANASGSSCMLMINFSGINTNHVTRIFNIQPSSSGGSGDFTAQVELTNGSNVSFAAVQGSAPCLDFGNCGQDPMDVLQDTEAPEAYNCDLTAFGYSLDWSALFGAVVPSGELGGSYSVPGSTTECLVHITVPTTLGYTKGDIVGFSAMKPDQSQLQSDGSSHHFYFFLEMNDGGRVKVTGYSECEAIAQCDNCVHQELVVNGSFEQYQAHSSAYGYLLTGYTMDPQFVSNTNLVNLFLNQWPLDNYTIIPKKQFCLACPVTGDHTYPDPSVGNYLAFSTAGSGNAPIWNHTVTVQPNQDYVFSAFFNRINHDGGNMFAELSINGTIVQVEALPVERNTWNEIRYVWNSGSATSVNLELAFNSSNNASSVNVIGLDDVSFGNTCPKACDSYDLIPNGSFNQGNNFFSSAFTYDPSGMALKYYSIVNQHNLGSSILYDHAVGNATGSFMKIVHQEPTTAGWYPIWQQMSVPVKPNTDYKFDLWFAWDVTHTDMAIQFDGQFTVFTSFNTGTLEGTWYKRTFLWNSGANTTMDIEVMAKMAKGSTVFLDDMSLKEVCPGSDFICDLKPTPQYTQPDPCVLNLMNIAEQNAELAYRSYLDEVSATFQEDLIAKCMGVYEKMEMEYEIASANQYTLSYYDQSGQLVRTIPPQGVDLLQNQALLDQVKQDRENGAQTVHPKHSMATTYHYNSLGQLVEQRSPDMDNLGGGTNDYANYMWYDELGRVVLSQDSRQEPENRYSYIRYDELGRMVEGGEIRTGGLPSDAINTLQNGQGQVIYSDFLIWLTNNSYQKYEVTETFYSTSPYATPYSQENLRNRIASVVYEKADDGDPANYDYATYFSYDIHGNVKQMVQEFKLLEDLGQRYKVLDYEYDLVSGKVHEITYQRGKKDEMHHRYSYDSDNRLKKVWVSIDGHSWDEDADYEYLPHGPRRRIELGDLKVQGLDYAYSIQGWMKGINSEALRPETDLGVDGYHVAANNLNALVAQDEFGLSLGYFNEGSDIDYKSVGSTQFLADRGGSHLEANLVGKDLYNGNINNVVTAIGKFMQNGQGPQAMRYRYDQMHRIKRGRVERAFDRNLNQWILGNPDSDDYLLFYSYDKNGNLIDLDRNGALSAGGLEMDELNYKYHTGSNQLKRVRDVSPGSANYNNDFEDQPLANYEYDPIGNLKVDKSECIQDIDWYANGKVKAVKRIPGCQVNGSYPPDLEFGYDGMGNRVEKLVKPKDGSGNLTDQSHWKFTYYMRDPSGNTIANYDRTFAPSGSGYYTDELKLTERPMYGAERIGMHGSDKRMAKVRYPATIDVGTKVFTIGNVSDITYLDGYVQSNPGEKAAFEIENGRLKLSMDGHHSGVRIPFKGVAGQSYTLRFNFTAGSPFQNFAVSVRENPVTSSFSMVYQENLVSNTYSYSFTASTNEMYLQFLQRLTAALVNAGNVTGTCYIDDIEIVDANGKTVFFEDYEGGSDVVKHDHGNKRFELKNHLGNVNTVLTDRRKNEGCVLNANHFVTAADVSQWSNAGAASLSLNNGRMEISTSNLYNGAYQNFTVVAGETYRVQAKLTASAGHIAKLIVYDLPNWNYMGAQTFNSTTGMVDFTFTPTSNSISVRIENLINGALASMYLDDFVLTQTSCDNFKADVVAAHDYYPFGWVMPGRSWTATNGAYRYGFNGMEKDEEWSGTNNSYDFGSRLYDSRTGRWASIDPQFKRQPGWSPYKAFLDNPILYIDPDGETETITIFTQNEKTGEVTVEQKKSNKIMTDGQKRYVDGIGDTWHYVNNYYDFNTVILRTVGVDGKVTEVKTSKINKKNGVKDQDFVWFDGAEVGHQKIEDYFAWVPEIDDIGGFVIYGSASSSEDSPGTPSNNPDWGSIDFSAFMDIMGDLPNAIATKGEAGKGSIDGKYGKALMELSNSLKSTLSDLEKIHAEEVKAANCLYQCKGAAGHVMPARDTTEHNRQNRWTSGNNYVKYKPATTTDTTTTNQ